VILLFPQPSGCKQIGKLVAEIAGFVLALDQIKSFRVDRFGWCQRSLEIDPFLTI